MTAFDISVLFFFACVLFKAVSDAAAFWREEDELYAAAPVTRHAAPLHRPAPVRHAPASIPVRRRAVVTCAKRKVTPIPVKKDMVA